MAGLGGGQFLPARHQFLTDCYERVIDHSFSCGLLHDGHAVFGQEKATLIAQHDGLAGWAVLILFELQFAQIAIRLLAPILLRPFQVLSEPKRAMPCCRSRNSGAGCDAGQARMAGS
jgi:hypothetical protein